VIEFANERPPVASDELADAERRLSELGQHIPRSYKTFLAHHDGGRPVENSFSYERDDREIGNVVNAFLGIAPMPGGNLIETAMSMWERIPAGVLPIAEDQVGNLICLDGRDGRDGPVLFWDHEYEGDPPDEANLYEIAPDLQTFLDTLIKDPDPPQVSAAPKGWRRILGRR